VKITMALTCFLFRAVGLTAHGTALGPTIRLMPTSLAGEGNEIEPAEAAAMKGRVFLICLAISGCGATVQENRPGREAIAKMIAFARLGPVPCKRLAPDAESFRALALLTLVKPPLTRSCRVAQMVPTLCRRDGTGPYSG
jgi:hypothetical protein